MGESAPERAWTDDPATFATALDDLKADGCLLLVVESAESDAGHAGCQRMLGADAPADRRRLFVRADTTARTTRQDADSHREVVYRTGARDAVAAPSPTRDATQTTTATDMDELSDVVETEVRRLAPADGYDAGQLRVCVDAIDDFVASNDLADVVEFVSELGDAVRDADGMAHVHVGQHVPATAVEGVLPQFDAVVEVADDNDPRQRWHLPDESLSTEWLSL